MSTESDRLVAAARDELQEVLALMQTDRFGIFKISGSYQPDRIERVLGLLDEALQGTQHARRD